MRKYRLVLQTTLIDWWQKKQTYIIQGLSSFITQQMVEDQYLIASALLKKGFSIPSYLQTQKGTHSHQDQGGTIWRCYPEISGDVAEINTKEIQPLAAFISDMQEILKTIDSKTIDFRNHTTKNTFCPQITFENFIQAKNDLNFKKIKKETRDLCLLIERTYLSFASKNPIENIHSLPKIIVHGDLKNSNILWSKNKVVGVIDLDTLQFKPFIWEIAEGCRNWFQNGDDDNLGNTKFKKEDFKTFLSLYRPPFEIKNTEEVIITALRYVVLQAAMRFARDSVKQNYFQLSSRYPNLEIQNKTRAQKQLDIFSQLF